MLTSFASTPSFTTARRALVVLGLLVLLIHPVEVALAQQPDETVGGSTLPTITVTGRGTATATPDQATFTAGVEVTAADLTTAQSEATQRMTAVLEALRVAGIQDDAIQTVGFRVEVVRGDEQPPMPVAADAPTEPVAASAPAEPVAAAAATPGPLEPRGFRVINEVRVTVDDLSRLGTVLDDALAAGANTVSGIGLTVADPSAAQSEARTQAIEDARARAEDLAAAASLQVGEVLTIVEGDGVAPPQPVLAEAQMAGSAVPIAPGQTEVGVAVRVTYQLVRNDTAGQATPVTTPAP